MFVFVSGAARSGKSAWAERAAVALAGAGPKVYLATARVEDEDMARRVERHRAMRAGKGFVTIERARGMMEILALVEPGATVLLESLSTWAANETFLPDGGIVGARAVEREILASVMALRARVRHLVIVSDDVSMDGARLDGPTEGYVRLLARLHVALAREAGAAVEVSCGLARWAKGSCYDDGKDVVLSVRRGGRT
ncbi:MAG: bifunctional adenosylcobinamide kinase/adenosylcobinamide-phosphate guanylyltransferase [Synergistaceae bacterium]|nr:bifunctional adenosylcobinamide kinase/adenosylcobinamide-phosphate guanylyltransferase [Synergistaceae bacterium]